jgi:hypothetical protein
MAVISKSAHYTNKIYTLILNPAAAETEQCLPYFSVGKNASPLLCIRTFITL